MCKLPEIKIYSDYHYLLDYQVAWAAENLTISLSKQFKVNTRLKFRWWVFENDNNLYWSERKSVWREAKDPQESSEHRRQSNFILCRFAACCWFLVRFNETVPFRYHRELKSTGRELGTTSTTIMVLTDAFQSGNAFSSAGWYRCL